MACPSELATHKKTRCALHRPHRADLCPALDSKILLVLRLTALPAVETPALLLAAAAHNPAAGHGNASTHAHSNGRPRYVRCGRCRSTARAAASAPGYR